MFHVFVIVDVHTHNMRAEHWGPEWTNHWQPAYGSWPTVTPDTYRSAMAPVSRSIVFGITANAVSVATPDEFTATFVATDPQKYIGFMALDPTETGVLERMEHGARHLGLRGIKLYPVLAGFDPSDHRWFPFFERAQQLQLVILWHFGANPSAAGRLRHSHPLLLEEVAIRCPDLRMVVAHIGHPWQKDTALILRKHPNVFADVSAVWARKWEGFNALISCMEWGVTDKLLFGSDYPLWTPSEALDELRALPHQFVSEGLPRLPADLIESIIQRDSLRLLGLD